MVDFSKINPSISTNGLNFKKGKKKETIEQAPVQPEAPKTDFLPADEVLSFLSSSNLPLDLTKGEKSQETKATKTIEVSKYVNPEQAKRIAGFVFEVEDYVVNGLKQFETEFGNLPEFKEMSDSSKLTMATEAFNRQYMPDTVENAL